MARSIENTANSLQPLTDEHESLLLDQITKEAQGIAARLSELYNGIAKRAFGPESA